MASQSSRSRARSIPKLDVQAVADAAARTALNEFANSPERKDELNKIMQAAIAGTLERFGMDPSDKAAVDKFRADMVHLRTWRELTELVKKDGIGAATSWFVKGILAMLTLGFLALLGKHLSGN